MKDSTSPKEDMDMAEHKIYIKIWNPDTNEDELRAFGTDEIDELMEMGIIDTDSLGYAMKDQMGFFMAMEIVKDREFTYAELANHYLELTGSDIIIE